VTSAELDQIVTSRAGSVAHRNGNERKAKSGRGKLPVGAVYLAPALGLYGLFLLVPLVIAIILSLYDWGGAGPLKFVGFRNYRDLPSTANLVASFLHLGVVIVFFVVVPILIGLILTGLLSRGHLRGLTFFRTVLFSPQVVALVAVAIVWEWILSPSGPVNEFLRIVGLGSFVTAWLGSFTFALPSVGVIGSWVGYGFAMVLFMAGVQKVPLSLFEAARIDGAGPFREFLHVTLPGIRSEIVVAVVLTISSAITTFDLVYVLTSGGPGFSTTVPAFSVYELAFVSFRVGLASAVGVVLAVLVFGIVLSIIGIARRWEG
jgi:raffinose/stachyose/melibiose transport system permease protein